MRTVDEVMGQWLVHALVNRQVHDIGGEVVRGHEIVGEPIQGELSDLLLGFVELIKLNKFLGPVLVVVREENLV